MKNIFYAILFLSLTPSISFAQKTKAPAPSKEPGTVKLKNEIDSISYAVGIVIGNNLKTNGFDTVNVALFDIGMYGVMTDQPLMMDPETANRIVSEYHQGLSKKKSSANIEIGKKFLADNKKKAGVVETASGLQYLVITEGKGEKPAKSNTVKVHYHGTLIDGTVFDSSVERGQPATFPLTAVISGWTEALQLMPVGSKYRLFLPSNLAYGEQATGKIQPHSVLIFDVELLGIEP